MGFESRRGQQLAEGRGVAEQRGTEIVSDDLGQRGAEQGGERAVGALDPAALVHDRDALAHVGFGRIDQPLAPVQVLERARIEQGVSAAEAEARSASIGTLGTLVGSAGAPLPDAGSSLTTPGPVMLQRTLRALADAGVRTVAMEVSSHSLAQRRVEGVRFVAAVFTNFTRDHLDYHGTMDAYFDAKASLVSHLETGGVAVVNDDDRAWDALPIAPRRVTFGVASTRADVRAEDLHLCPDGARFRCRGVEYHSPLAGRHGVSNVLAAPGPGPGAGEYAVAVSFMVTRTRGEQGYQLFTGRREDTLRRQPGGALRIARRRIFVDQTVITATSLSILF
jgi:hypothetical protein